jgi:hypothetical protein
LLSEKLVLLSEKLVLLSEKLVAFFSSLCVTIGKQKKQANNEKEGNN